MLVDDHKVVRDGMELLLGLHPELDVVASSGSAAEAFTYLRTTAVDVVVMDLAMPAMDGVEATSIIKRDHPDVDVVMLTSFQDQAALRAAMEGGARGFLLKSVSGDDLARAIRAAADGQSTIDPDLLPGLFAPPAGPAGAADLTDREQQVLDELATGETNQQIADRLGISPGTVRVYVSNVLAKLGASNRTEAAAIALRYGLTERLDP